MGGKRKILGACLGNCVHVAGVMNFLSIAEEEGYVTHFLGAAIPVDILVEQIYKEKPDIVALSYRLTPEVAESLFLDLKSKIRQKNIGKTSFIFGGTEPVAKIAQCSKLFDHVFTPKSHASDIFSYLRQQMPTVHDEEMPQDILGRILHKRPCPVLRHHYGRPSLTETIEGIREIAESRVLDVVSLGPDQNAQQFFFCQDKMDPSQSGAGGVPIRSQQDLQELFQATRYGNFPIMRCYSGTNDLIKMADLLQKTIHNAWAAIPLCWYNALDRRSERGVQESISENLYAVEWHAKRNIPVEMNEPHHWGLREAHDAITVATAYLAAYNAKNRGVKHYISQYMLNTPKKTSHIMDMAKTLAQIELVESLHDKHFISFRQFRAGLFSFPENPDKAMGQLAASTYLAMALRPDIYHVVGYSEGHHAAMASEVIRSCSIAQQVIDVSMKGVPDTTLDPRIQERKNDLIKDAKIIIKALSKIAGPEIEDPLTDTATIAKAIRIGILDAPHLAGNKFAKGSIITKEIDGAYYAYDPINRRIIEEKERIKSILSEK